MGLEPPSKMILEVVDYDLLRAFPKDFGAERFEDFATLYHGHEWISLL